jgi:hypothetical protein
MRNPNHTFRGNHAAGSTGNGFFFEAVPDPDEDDDEEPAVALDAFAFAGNVAHSNWHGRFRAGGGPAITNGHGLLLLGALEGELDEGDAVIEDYTGYMNSNSGAWLESGREHLVGGVLADNVAAVQAEPGPVLRDLVVVGRSRNGIGENLVDSEGVSGAQRQAQGVLFDDDMARTFRLEDSTLIGLGDGVIVLEDTFTFPDGRGGRTRGLTLIDSAPFDASEAIFAGTGAIVDSDGTLTGNGPGARLPAPEEAPT